MNSWALPQCSLGTASQKPELRMFGHKVQEAPVAASVVLHYPAVSHDDVAPTLAFGVFVYGVGKLHA